MTAGASEKLRTRLDLLDYGRLAAAIAVMAYHYFHNGILNGKLQGMAVVPAIDQVVRYGYLGVHFFFIISGYVIFYSASGKTAGVFLAARGVRLFPAFWAALLLTSVVAQFLGGPSTSVNLLQAVANVTMFPQWFGQNYVDGVYWTLQYEWRFYGAVFLLLLIGRKGWLECFFITWPWWILFARLAELPQLPLAEGYFSLFSAGALFAMCSTRKTSGVLVSLALSVLLAWKFALEQAAGIENAKGVHLDPVVISSCVLSFFGFFALLLTSRARSLEIPGAQWAGAITYPLYLLHAHIGYMLLTALSGVAPVLLVYGLTISLVLCMALLLHWCVERRAGAWWQRFFSGTVGRFVHGIEIRLNLLVARSTNSGRAPE